MRPNELALPCLAFLDILYPVKLHALFDDRLFYKSLLVIAIPIMLQNLISALVNLLDTIMIGQLGTGEIAAVGLGNQVFFFYNLVLFGICSGSSIFTAQFWGKKDIAGIRKTAGLCMLLSAAVGLLFTLGAFFIPERLIGIYSYDPAVIELGALYLKKLAPAFIPFAVSLVLILTLRSVERLKLAMTSTLITLSLNIVLNYFLIFGIGPFPKLGVAGAALATAISRLIEMIILLTVSYLRRYPPAGSLRELLAFDSAFFRRFFRIAFPVILNEIIWTAGVSAQNIIFARTTTDAIAAFHITNTVSQLAWVAFIGLGNGAGVLIGKRIGEGSKTLAYSYAARIIILAPLLSLGAIVLLIPLSRLLPFVFNVNDAVLSTAALMFIVLCASYPFRAFNMAMLIGVCRAGGDTLFCIIYDIVFMWTVALPLAALAAFVFHAPVWLIYLCICIEEPFKMMLGIWRYKSGKWLNNVTEGI